MEVQLLCGVFLLPYFCYKGVSLTLKLFLVGVSSLPYMGILGNTDVSIRHICGCHCVHIQNRNNLYWVHPKCHIWE